MSRARPNAVRVATRYRIAKAESVNDFVQEEWLPEVGKEIVKRVGGSYQVKFERGFKLSVTSGLTTDRGVGVITLRVSTGYRTGSILYLSRSIGGDEADVDQLDYGSFSGMSADRIATWAVASVAGMGQAELPFTKKERAQRQRTRSRREQKGPDKLKW